MTDTKTCRECGTTKPLDDFYKHKQMADGRLNKCKECVKGRVASHRQKNIDQIKANDRNRSMLPHRVQARAEYAQTEAGREARRRASKKYYENHPEKRAANVKVGNAIRDGRLTRQPCWCGETKVDAHHHDYSKPLDVVWLCRPHHAELHRSQ